MPLFAKREDEAEVNISGIRVFVTMVLVFCSALPLVWLIVRHWIFAP